MTNSVNPFVKRSNPHQQWKLVEAMPDSEETQDIARLIVTLPRRIGDQPTVKIVSAGGGYHAGWVVAVS